MPVCRQAQGLADWQAGWQGCQPGSRQACRPFRLQRKGAFSKVVSFCRCVAAFGVVVAACGVLYPALSPLILRLACGRYLAFSPFRCLYASVPAGGELALTWMDKAANGEITYSAYLNLGFARDRWDVLDEDATYREGGNLHALSKQGKAEGILTGLIADHLLTDPAEVEALKAKGFKQFGRDPYLGGILYKDTRGDGYSEGPDGRIDSNDEYNLLSENGTPRINYGFGGSIKWKGITLDVHFQGVGKYDRFVGGVDGGFYQHGGTIRPYFPIWTSDKVYDPELNPDGVYPRITGTSWYESGAGNTSYWMRNGAYLRLKNLNIGYDLPMAILRPLGITHAQVFANATNLFCISAVTEFLDPEQEYYDSYPLMRTFSFGLNFSF